MGFFGLFTGKGATQAEHGSTEPSRKATWESESRRDRIQVSLSPLATIEGRVIAAFTKVRQDISLLSSWVKYLRHKDMMNEQRHTKTQRELGEHKVHISGLKSETAELKAAIRQLHEELKEARDIAKTAKMVRERTEISPLTDLIRTKSELNPDRKRHSYFESKVVSMLRSRRKDYVLKQILELAERQTYSTREIEEIIVGEKALCGRTAFYDYFKELRHKKMIRQTERGAKKVIVSEKHGLEEVR